MRRAPAVIACAALWSCSVSEAADAPRLLGVALSPDLTAAEAAVAASHFESVTPENAMKWRSLAPTPAAADHTAADALISFAEAHGMSVRGHALVWGRLNGVPRWLDERLAAAEDPRATLRDLLRTHVRDTVGRYAGSVAEWDVVNEPLAFPGATLDEGNPVIGLLGEEGIVEVFQWAAEADPSARLYLNEIGLEADDARFEGFMALLRRLLAAGAPIHGVGFQGHYARPPDALRLQGRMEAIATLGLESAVTELDLPLRLFADAEDPVAAQAEAFGAVASACAAVAGCRSVTVWGLHDGVSWLGEEARALPIGADLAPKPALAVLRSVLRPDDGERDAPVGQPASPPDSR